jgi:hypothetical protein
LILDCLTRAAGKRRWAKQENFDLHHQANQPGIGFKLAVADHPALIFQVIGHSRDDALTEDRRETIIPACNQNRTGTMVGVTEIALFERLQRALRKRETP